jgi:hypothetical protein
MLPKLHRWQLLWNILTEIAETGLILGSLFGVGNDILRSRLTVVKSRNVLFLKVHMDN